MRCFFFGFAGFFIAAIVTVVAMASYDDYAARASLAETMSKVDLLRVNIAENIQNLGTVKNSGTSLGAAAAKNNFPSADYLKVTADGTIVFRSEKHGQIIVLEPEYSSGVLTWKCVGSKPEKNIPRDCR